MKLELRLNIGFVNILTLECMGCVSQTQCLLVVGIAEL